MLKRPREELEGQRLAFILPVPSRVFTQTHVIPELTMRGRIDEVYVSLLTSTGTEVPVVMNLRRVLEEDRFSNVCAFVAMRRRRLFEKELIRSNAAAAEAVQAERRALDQVHQYQTQMAVQERLVTLGTLAAGVAHEINNPLSFVLANLELAEEQLEEVPDSQLASSVEALLSLLAETRDGAERIARIVRGLKSLSREDATKQGAVDLGAVIETATRLSAHEVSPLSAVIVDITSPAPVVLADEGRLVQVFVNLLINAAQAMPTRPTTENSITVRARVVEPHVLVEVSDNGAGMARDIQAHIFDPFFTTKAAGVGTGLGLPVCQGIVTSFGGSLSVTSEEGVGTTFQLRLPVGQAAHLPQRRVRAGRHSELPSPPAQRRSAVVKAPRRALLVEDEPAVVRMLTRALDDYEVVVADGLRETVEVLGSGSTFDVILCDMMLQNESGVEVHEYVKRNHPDLTARMIFMSGGARDEASREFLADLESPFIEKPFSIRAVRAACDAMCERDVAANTGS